MDTFKQFYKDAFSKTGTRRYVNGPRHRKDTFTDTDKHYRRQRQNLVADMYKKDNSKNQKIESLKNASGTFVCNQSDLDYIHKVFNVVPGDKPKVLGRTGITIYRDPRTNQIIVRK